MAAQLPKPQHVTHARRASVGVCRQCGERRARVRCGVCLAANRADYRARILAGQCVFCKEAACAGAFCLHHWFKNIGSAYKLNKKNGGIELLKQVWDEQQGRCAVTGLALIPGHNASLDHIVPVSKGGVTSRGNLRWVLFEINRAKADMSHDQFVELCAAVVRAQEPKVRAVSPARALSDRSN